MDNLRGILFMIAAMIGFTFEDIFIKSMSQTMSVSQILIMLGIGAAIIFLTFSRIQGDRFFLPAAWTPIVICRAVFDGVAAVAFATSLSLIDISMVAAVFQALPLVITMGAALFLGETVGWRRWSAIIVGFLGVLMIIRPGLEGFEPAALWVLVSVIGVAGRDLITRRIDATVASGVVSAQAFFATAIAGVVLCVVNGQELRMPDAGEWKFVVLAMVFGVSGYYGIVIATRIAEASVVTPFRYSRLVFSMLGGMVVFAERPDMMTVLGATLIIATGLYTFLRERRLLNIQPS